MNPPKGRDLGSIHFLIAFQGTFTCMKQPEAKKKAPLPLPTTPSPAFAKTTFGHQGLVAGSRMEGMSWYEAKAAILREAI